MTLSLQGGDSNNHPSPGPVRPAKWTTRSAGPKDPKWTPRWVGVINRLLPSLPSVRLRTSRPHTRLPWAEDGPPPVPRRLGPRVGTRTSLNPTPHDSSKSDLRPNEGRSKDPSIPDRRGDDGEVQPLHQYLCAGDNTKLPSFPRTPTTRGFGTGNVRPWDGRREPMVPQRSRTLHLSEALREGRGVNLR